MARLMKYCSMWEIKWPKGRCCCVLRPPVSDRLMPKVIKVVEVAPRDGLQNEKALLPTSIKVELIDRVATAGTRHVEATSFVSPKWVPQLADAAEVMQ